MVPSYPGIDLRDRKASRNLSFAFQGLVLTSVACLAGCTSKEINHENIWYVWPLEDIRQVLREGLGLATRPGLVLPDGISPATIIENDALKVQPAFVEEKTAAYVTTDLWLDSKSRWKD